MTTFERVKDTIVEILGIDPEKVTLEATFRDDLKADSLDLVELIMGFEDAFRDEHGKEIEISDEDAKDIKTVGDTVAYLDKLLKEQGLA